MAKDVKFNIKLRVDGKDVVVRASTNVRQLADNLGLVQDSATAAGREFMKWTQGVMALGSVTNSIQQISGVLNALTEDSRSFGMAAKVMTAHAAIPWVGIAIGAGFVAAMLGIMKSLPKFAEGGLAYGPTLGLFGEYAGAGSNPEVVAPLDRLRSMIEPQGVLNGKVEFEIRGRRLVGVLRKENSISQRS